MKDFWKRFFYGNSGDNVAKPKETKKKASTDGACTPLMARAKRLRETVGGTAKPKLVDEVNDLGTTMGHTFVSTGLPGRLAELEKVVLGIESDPSAKIGDLTIVDGVQKMWSDLGLAGALSTSAKNNIETLEVEMFGAAKDGDLKSRFEVLKAVIYESP